MTRAKHNGHLQLDPKNARRHSPRNQALIRQSLEAVGAGRSILADANGIVRAGNGVFEQAQALGIPVKIIESDGKSLIAVKRTDLKGKAAIRAAALDNLAADSSAFDYDAEILAEIARDDELIAQLAREEKAIAALLKGEAKPEPVDPGELIDKAAELQKKWRVQRGDIWEIGKHRLMCGDSTSKDDVERLMDGKRAQAVVTDSPYGIDREGIKNDDPQGLRELFDGVLTLMPIDNAVVVNFQSPRLFPIWLDASRAAGHKFERMLWLDKINDEAKPWRGWILKSESILLSSVGRGQWNEVKPYSHDSYRITSIGTELPKEWGRTHTAVKPLAVVSDIASRVCASGAIIYDPFLGSGTTLVACEQTGRIGHGMEIEPKYCAVTLERLSNLGLTPRKVSDGKALA